MNAILPLRFLIVFQQSSRRAVTSAVKANTSTSTLSLTAVKKDPDWKEF